jgi:hypothetical protein
VWRPREEKGPTGGRSSHVGGRAKIEACFSSLRTVGALLHQGTRAFKLRTLTSLTFSRGILGIIPRLLSRAIMKGNNSL